MNIGADKSSSLSVCLRIFFSFFFQKSQSQFLGCLLDNDDLAFS